MNLSSIYSDISFTSNRVGVPVKKLIDMFFLIKDGPVNNNELILSLGVSKNSLNQSKKYLSKYLTPSSETTQLKSMYQGLQFNDRYKTEYDFLSFTSDSEIFNQVLSFLNKHNEFRPLPDRKLDQFTATNETTAKRVSLLNFFGDIENKKILLLGDDDFVSTGINLLETSNQIWVLDLDQRILDNIKSISPNVHTLKANIKDGLPNNLIETFDVVFTDPPYTHNGILLFISRAIQALNPLNKSARIYCCYGNSDGAKERYLSIYDIFVKSGLMIRWAFDKFNRYHGAESIGNSSTLFILDTTPKTKSLIKNKFIQDIYTY